MGRDKEVAALIAVVLLVVMAIVVGADYCTSTTRDATVSVIERHHKDAESSIDVGWAMGDKDDYPIITHHHEPERWTVIVKDGPRAMAVQVSALVWERSQPGTHLRLRQRIGGLTGRVLSSTLHQQPEP